MCTPAWLDPGDSRVNVSGTGRGRESESDGSQLLQPAASPKGSGFQGNRPQSPLWLGCGVASSHRGPHPSFIDRGLAQEIVGVGRAPTLSWGQGILCS